MNELSILVILGAALISIDIVNAYFVFTLNRRMRVMEGDGHVADGICLTCRTTCASNAAAINALTVIVSRHTDEIAQIRKIGNERQSEILNAIHLIHADVMESIEKRIMPKAVLEAALRDLYNRTTERDPDTEPRVDADVP